MTETRLLRKDEWRLASALWKYCFGDTDEFIDWYFKRKAGDIIGTFEGDELAAQIVLAPLTLSIRGAAKSAVIFSGVATAPAFRRRGYMTALTRAAFRRLAEEGVSVASLYPFNYAYYERFGFAGCGETAKVRISLERLAGLKRVEESGEIRVTNVHDLGKEVATAEATKTSGTSASAEISAGAETVETAESSATAETSKTSALARDLVRAYDSSFSGYSGRSIRDAGYFTSLLEEIALDNGYAAIYSRNGKEEGYMLYYMEGKTLVVTEIGASSPGSRSGLLSFIGGHASSMSDATFTCPLDAPLWRSLPDPRGSVSAEPYNMLRVVDIGQAIRGLQLSANAGEVVIRVEDPFAPWNEGVWSFRASHGTLSTAKESSDEFPDAPTLSIREITRWLTGGGSAGALLTEGAGLSESQARDMDKLLPPTPFFLYEMY